MKVPLNDIIILYEKLLEELNVAEMSVIIFTALDVDALCSLKILTVNIFLCRHSSKAKTFSIRFTPNLPILNWNKK